MVKCFQEDCTIHESWYVLELLEHIKELTEQLQNTSSNSDYAKCLQRFCDLLDDDDCFDWHGDISGFIEKYKKHFA